MHGLTVRQGPIVISFRPAEGYDAAPFVEVVGHGEVLRSPDNGLANWIFDYEMQTAYQKADEALRMLKDNFEGIKIKENLK